MKMSLMNRFILLVLPLFVLGGLVTYVTHRHLTSSLAGVNAAFELSQQASRSAFYVSDMGSAIKSYMLDPKNDGEIKAKYAADEANAKAFARMKELTKDTKLLKMISEMSEFDEKKLNPAENHIVEFIKAGELTEAMNHYLKVYKPLHARYGDLSESLTKAAQYYTFELLKESEENLIKATDLISYGLLIGLIIVALTIIGATFRIVKSIKKISESLGNAAEHTGSFSRQLSGASQQLSGEATDSAGSLQESVASIEELSSMVKLNADNAREALKLAQSSHQAAQQGESEMHRLNVAMKDISTSSKRIEEIINVIDDIAFQTNLLALNAAVEAARAGEQGKGFAVVAEAVRSLAARSALAAKDINSLIKESVVKIGHGSKMAEESGVALKNILIAVGKVSELNQQIASASQEQSTGITQISRAMNDLDQSTQRNAASAEEVAASAEQMSTQAAALQDEVKNLHKLVSGRSGQYDDRDLAKDPGISNTGPQVRLSINSTKNKGNSIERGIAVGSNKVVRVDQARYVNPEDVIPLGDEPSPNIKTTSGF
jgi:methyl-accepting chemotaxis protein